MSNDKGGGASGRVGDAELRQFSVGWIASADAKATGIATISAVVLGLIYLDGTKYELCSGLWVLYIAFLGSLAATVASSLAVIWPRINRVEYLGVSAKGVKSPTFFGDVEASFDDFRKGVTTPEALALDAIEQTYIVARIATTKMRWVRINAICFGMTLILLLILAGIGKTI